MQHLETLPVAMNGLVCVVNENSSAKEPVAVRNAIIWIAELPSAVKVTVPDKPVTTRFVNGKITPDVLCIQTNQPVRFVAEDDKNHDLCVSASQRDLVGRLTLPKDPRLFIESFSKPEVDVLCCCAIHAREVAHVTVVPNQFWAISDDNGKFQIFGTLPVANYTLQAYHHQFGKIKKSIKIAEHEPVSIDLLFPNSPGSSR